MNKAIFIDKDGTLVEYIPYEEKPKAEDILRNILMEDEVVEGLKYLQRKGFKLIIVSNQPWIAKGHVTTEEIENLFKELVLKLINKGVNISDYFFCPHQTSDNCECKKPKPKMIFDAAKKHNVDLSKSFMIGDMDLDIKTGEKAGIKTFLVLTGRGESFKDIVYPTYILKNINEINKIL